MAKMSEKEKLEQMIAGFPEDVKNAHKHSSKHRRELEASDLCGCFYCFAIFKPQVIETWLQEGDGTALCPECGIDSVIGSASGYPITENYFLG